MPFTAATVPAYRVAKTVSGNAPFRQVYNAGGTLVRGNFVTMGTAGTVTAAGDDPGSIVGLAENDATSGQPVVVVHATDDIVFSGKVGAGAPMTEADIGSAFDLDAAGVMLDQENGQGLILGLDLTDSTAAAGTRVLFTVLPAFRKGGISGVVAA